MNNIKLPIFKTLLKSTKNLDFNRENNTGMKQLLHFIDALADGKSIDDPFFSKALKQIRKETEFIPYKEENELMSVLQEYWKVFFPEGLLFFKESDKVIKEIRKTREVSIIKLNENPIHNIPDEMTFTSNILLTIPEKKSDLNKLDLPDSLKKELPLVMKEEQLFWFDHPVQMGELPEKNEIIYGLKGLSDTLRYEKEMQHVPVDSTLDVILSVSVTHKGLQKLAAPYLQYELGRCNEIKDLNVYIFTERDCKQLLESYSENPRSISKYFGVDGKYGRHYNFLKAINALWRSAVNKNLKGTFKIDLDQIFPQKELLAYTGKSAFEHFKSPLWGAHATDVRGKIVDLSMIAGALVNESDINKSLFTPDVSLPDSQSPLSDLVFFKHLSMALSTRAELMTRYNGEDGLDGKTKAISRIHVTGGTNGILVKALLKYRPFTPSFIGRAEDQAYILSVLNNGNEPLLRYFHEDGLVMRHDKEAFAGESIKSAKDGTYIADIMRLLYYTFYSKVLPGGSELTKEETYPFTGSYITKFPVTLSYMRLVFKLIEMHKEGLTERADAMLELGRTRLQPLISSLIEKNFLASEYNEEKTQWYLFYDEIEKLDRALEKNETKALDNLKKIKEVIYSCQII